MEHFVRVVMEKNNNLNESLDESIFPGAELLETEQGASVYHIPLPRLLSEEEADEYADKLANFLFSEGYEDFDIEVSTGDDSPVVEETYDDDDEFYEQYGEMWYNEDEDQ